jgi:hypothetical protein
MNQVIIAMTPNIELEEKLLATGTFRFCDNQSQCGPDSNPRRPTGVFWRHNDTPDNVVPVGWTHVNNQTGFTECPFCVRSNQEILGEDYNEIEHDQIEEDTLHAPGTTGIHRQATSSPNSSTSVTSLKKKPSKSKTPTTPSDKELLANAKKMGMPSSAIEAMKKRLKQNKRRKATKRFLKFEPVEYTPSKSKSKSKSKKKKSKSQTKKNSKNKNSKKKNSKKKNK